jgi:hypothetical protein
VSCSLRKAVLPRRTLGTEQPWPVSEPQVQRGSISC